MPRYRLPMYRERPAMRCINFLCTVLLTMVLVAGIIMFVLWLSLRPHRPRFFLNDFTIPNLNRQSGAVNLPVRFTVDEQNPNQKVGIHYEEIYGSVYYNNLLVASGLVYQPFYQPPKGDTPLLGELTASGPTSDDPAWKRFAGDAVAGSVALRLQLNSKVRFEVHLWDTREHHMKVDCEFSLRGDGTLQQVDKNKQCTLYF